MGLVPDHRKESVFAFVQDHIRSRDYRSYNGIMGTKALIDVMQENGQQSFLLEVIRNREFPGWGHIIETLGASTPNSNWNGQRDYNHCMFGSVNEFFYTDLLGIQLDRLGLEKHVVIAPIIPDNIEFARGESPTPYGTVQSDWAKTGGMSGSV